MNKKVLRIVIPIVAIAIIAESIILFNRKSSIAEPMSSPTLTQEASEAMTLRWNVDMSDVKVGEAGEIPLVLTSEEDMAIDAVDLYMTYDSGIMSINSVATSKDFVAPSFKKINPEKGLVVMNFLVSEASGYQLKAGQEVELARLSVNYNEEGTMELGLGEGTLVVENGTAKVLPFNSDKLVINVSR